MEIREITTDAMLQMQPVFERAWEAAGDSYPLDVDWDMYRALMHAGQAVWLGVFAGSRPVGYASVLYIRETFNPAVRTAFIDSVYVDRPYRKYWGGRLIEAVRKRAESACCRRLVLGVDDALLAMFGRHGFRKVENIIEQVF